jgi:hypothetical protein
VYVLNNDESVKTRVSKKLMTKAIFVKTIKRNFLYKSWFFKNTVIPTKVKNKEAAIRYSPSLKPKIYMPTNDLPNNKIEHNNIKNALNKKDFVLNEFMKFSF